MGMYVFKVTGENTAGPNEVALKAQIKQQLQLQKAQSDVAQDVDNLQDALAGQTPLDRLPGNLGLVALQGTLDTNGNAQDGSAAPIPGGTDLKNAIVKADLQGVRPDDGKRLHFAKGVCHNFFSAVVQWASDAVLVATTASLPIIRPGAFRSKPPPVAAVLAVTMQ